MTDTPPKPPPLPPQCMSRITSYSMNSSLRNKTHEEKGHVMCFCDMDIYSEQQRVTQIKPVAQFGPNCGIAALAMVVSLTPNELTVEDIFTKAKSSGFTNNGEMFSAENMKALTEAVVLPWFKTEMFNDGLLVNKSYVIERLYSGDLILIPYDADKDHSPCCRDGHKAHWALVCGVSTDPAGKVSVAARHGKSRHVAMWCLEQLHRSNANLAHLDPERVVDGREYVLPDGGLQAGLAKQFILIRRSDSEPRPATAQQLQLGS